MVEDGSKQQGYLRIRRRQQSAQEMRMQPDGTTTQAPFVPRRPCLPHLRGNQRHLVYGEPERTAPAQSRSVRPLL